MYKIQKNLHGYFIDHETLGAIFLPEEMLDFIVMYLTNEIDSDAAIEKFAANYNQTVKDGGQK